MSSDTVPIELSLEECLALLHVNRVGRIAVVIDDFPIVLPVNYRLVDLPGKRWIAMRTREGNVLSGAPNHAAFEIDGYDEARRSGWSVLVRGTLHPVDADAAGFRERFDPDPWAGGDRDAWLVVEAFAITGRRIDGDDEPGWAFDARGYR